MNKEQFVEKYCFGCGSQRCEGIDSEWGEGCQYRWNLDGMDPAAEIERLNKKIMELSTQIVRLTKDKENSKIIYNQSVVQQIKELLKQEPDENTEKGIQILNQMFVKDGDRYRVNPYYITHRKDELDGGNNV